MRASELVPRAEIDAALCAWLKHTDSQYLHVKGLPGTGKTSWARLLAAKTELHGPSGELLAKVAATHFCSRSDAASASGLVFIERVALQLCRLDSCFREAFVASAGGRRSVEINVSQLLNNSPNATVVGVEINNLTIRAERPEDVIEELLTKPLRTALAGPGPVWLIGVDAPDEPLASGVAELLTMLGDLPNRLRIVVTSRPDTEFAQSFETLAPAPLDLAKLASDTEIGLFVERRTAASKIAWRLTADLSLISFRETIVDRANGNFLVAKTTIDAICSTSGSISQKTLAELPGDLSKLYRTFLSWLPSDIKQRWAEETGRLIGTLAVAQEPLSENELSEICLLPASVVAARLASLNQYLVSARQGTAWRIFHATFAEFLLDRQAAGAFWCPAAEQHKRIVAWAIPDVPFKRWARASHYALAHLIHHRIGASGNDLIPDLKDILCEAFVRARLERESAGFGFAADIRLALAAAAQEGDVGFSLFLALLLQCWNDRAAQRANPSSTILLAAMGQVAEAGALALRQDEVGHCHTYEQNTAMAAFAASLVELGEKRSARDFVDSVPQDARREVAAAYVEALAQRDPEFALAELSALSPRAEPLALGPQACRIIARLPAGVDAARGAARYGESLLGVACGLAAHDLDAAIELSGRINHQSRWLGGEKLSFGPSYGYMQVLSAYLEDHPGQVGTVVSYVTKLLGRRWHGPHALSFAGKVVSADPTLWKLSCERLGVEADTLKISLVRAWLLANGASDFGPVGPDPFDPMNAKQRERRLILARYELRDVLPMIATINPTAVARDTTAFNELFAMGQLLLEALRSRPDRPETKSYAARDLGRLFAWLGHQEAYVFNKMASEEWQNESWIESAREGVAEALAYRGIDAYLKMPETGFGSGGAQNCATIAARVIAEGDPDAAVRLFEVIPIGDTTTRADVAGIIALSMRASNRGSIASLTGYLATYVTSGRFGGILRTLDEVFGHAKGDVPLSGAEVAVTQLSCAITSKSSFDLGLALHEIESLSSGVGTPVRGEIIWASELRRRFAQSFFDVDSRKALRAIVPVASFKELREIASRMVDSNPAPEDPDDLAELMLESLAHFRDADLGLFSKHYVALAFALALPTGKRCNFLATVVGSESSRKAILLGCTAVEEPTLALDRIENVKGSINADDGHADLVDDMLARWIRQLALGKIAESDPLYGLARLNAMNLDEPQCELLAKAVVDNWPIERWRECVDELVARSEDRHMRQWAGLAIEPALARAATRYFIDVMQYIDEVGCKLHDRGVGIDQLLKEIVKSAAPTAPLPAWPTLIATTRRIGEVGPRSIALGALLAAAAKVPAGGRREAVALTIGEIGKQPREKVFMQLGAMGAAARAADPAVEASWPTMAERLRAILVIDPDVACRRSLEKSLSPPFRDVIP